MNDSLSQLIADSENDYLNVTHWQIYPIFLSIQKGDEEALEANLNVLKKEKFSFDDRMGTDEKKYYEYMIVSLINTFMIAAVQGGVYPPKANSVADSALHTLSVMRGSDNVDRFITDKAREFCGLTVEARENRINNAHINNAINYIRTHLTQNLSVDDIAGKVFLSKYHLIRLFREHTGMTVSEYIQHERIKAAAEYLSSSNKSISEIASLFCFCDQSYFTYVFRKVTGFTPNQYRNGIRK